MYQHGPIQSQQKKWCMLKQSSISKAQEQLYIRSVKLATSSQLLVAGYLFWEKLATSSQLYLSPGKFIYLFIFHICHMFYINVPFLWPPGAELLICYLIFILVRCKLKLWRPNAAWFEQKIWQTKSSLGVTLYIYESIKCALVLVIQCKRDYMNSQILFFLIKYTPSYTYMYMYALCTVKYNLR